jgi:putative glutamine amidotransferase
LIGIPAANQEPNARANRPDLEFRSTYTNALAACGALPLIIPLWLADETLQAIFARLDGLCLTGGVDVDPAHYGEEPHPALGRVDAERDRTELLLARWALQADLPILAICRGIQVLNVAAGGSLYQDIAAQVPGALLHTYRLADSPWERPTHRVRIAHDSKLAALLEVEEWATNSFHHQAVREVGEGFRPVAWTDDGIIEAIEQPARRFALGVQWHPEGMFDSDPLARRLFAAFVAACCP